MPRFAVCYVPPSHSPFYRLATGIIRHDVRAGRLVSENNAIRAQIPGFSERFVERTQLVGLHCTVVGPYDCRRGDLPAIELEIRTCLGMLDPQTRLSIRNHEEFVAFWGKDRQIVALQYDPNTALVILHTLLLTRLIALLGYAPRLKAMQQAAHHVGYENKRLIHFGSPHVLDGYHPHFTLLYPYTGNTHEHIAALLQGVFGGFKEHVWDSICLLTQDKAGQRWRIHTEFVLPLG
jgi:hypothetical protein